MREILGYRFRLMWPATGMTVIVNAEDVDAADKKLWRYKQKGALARYLGTCAPLPKTLRPKMPKKVF